jgi:hypothetical protein
MAGRALRAVALVMSTMVVSAATKGPDAGGYTASDGVVYSLVDISGSGGGTSVLAGVDDGAVALTLPFPFRFYGRTYTQVCASSNGALYFVSAAGECSGLEDFGNGDLTTAATVKDLPAALPLWSDLTFDAPGAGAVYYQTVGAPGSRRFVVQWQNAYPQGSPNPVTFQILLSELTHKVLFQYQSVALGAGNAATSGGQATVGIRNTQGVTNQQQIAWSFQAPVIGNETALEFSVPITRVTGDVDGDGVVTCADASIVKAAFGKRLGQPGFDARADVNGDRSVNIVDLSTVTRALPAGTTCS